MWLWFSPLLDAPEASLRAVGSTMACSPSRATRCPTDGTLAVSGSIGEQYTAVPRARPRGPTGSLAPAETARRLLTHRKSLWLLSLVRFLGAPAAGYVSYRMVGPSDVGSS
jgi:hypothetical protein